MLISTPLKIHWNTTEQKEWDRKGGGMEYKTMVITVDRTMGGMTQGNCDRGGGAHAFYRIWFDQLQCGKGKRKVKRK